MHISIRSCIFGGVTALLLGVRAVHACPNPNPNLLAGDGIHQFIDGCFVPAGAINRLVTDPLTLNINTGITTSGGGFIVNSYSGVNEAGVANAIDGGNDWDLIQSALRLLPGSTIKNAEAFGGYVSNQLASGGVGQNAAVNFGIITCEVNNCASWGANWIVTGGSRNVVDTQIGRKLVGIELDMSGHSASDTIQGIGLRGSTLVQPAGATGFTVGQMDSQQGTPGAVAQWTNGFNCGDGVISPTGTCLTIGASLSSGSNVGSQLAIFGYRDGSGTPQAFHMQVAACCNFVISDTGTGHSTAINTATLIGANGSSANSPSYNFQLLYQNASNITKAYTIAVNTVGQLSIGGNDTTPTVILPGVVLPSVTTGTPAASLCLDASNNVIKKTTTGSCV